jgi:hypothetical protein
MKNNDLKKLLEQDVADIKGLIIYEGDDSTDETAKVQARAIILNLKEHLEEFLDSPINI